MNQNDSSANNEYLSGFTEKLFLKGISVQEKDSSCLHYLTGIYEMSCSGRRK
jgi:hypothetical protein